MILEATSAIAHKGPRDLVSTVVSKGIVRITPLRGSLTPVQTYLLSPLSPIVLARSSASCSNANTDLRKEHDLLFFKGPI